MKILFVNPPAEFTIPEAPREDGKTFVGSEDFGAFPPLGMLYVLSYLEKHAPGHQIVFKDCIGENISHGKLAEIIREIQPDVLGITSFTISMVDVSEVAKSAREAVPNIHICLGGHHPIAFPEQAAEIPNFDSIVVGEGEQAFAELIGCLERQESFTHITGVYTRESMRAWVAGNTAIVDKRFLKTVTVPAAYVDDIESLPIPDRRYIRHIGYGSIVGVSSKLATILSTRGCPYLCTFCDVPYKKYRTRSIVSVVDEVETCMAMGYDEFHFYDDLFNITPRKVLEFCDEVERRNLKFTWDFRGRANPMTEECVTRAKRAGCRMISFGVETGTDEGLKYLKKGTNTTKIKQVFQWCREAGIITIADFIIGFPFERTEDDVRKNLDFLINDLDPDYVQLAILMLLPNTPLFDEALEKGLIKPGYWEEFAANPQPTFQMSHWEEHLSLATLTRLQAEAYRAFYFRPKYILRSILRTRSLYEFTAKARAVLKLIKPAEFVTKIRVLSKQHAERGLQ